MRHCMSLSPCLTPPPLAPERPLAQCRSFHGLCMSALKCTATNHLAHVSHELSHPRSPLLPSSDKQIRCPLALHSQDTSIKHRNSETLVVDIGCAARVPLPTVGTHCGTRSGLLCSPLTKLDFAQAGRPGGNTCQFTMEPWNSTASRTAEIQGIPSVRSGPRYRGTDHVEGPQRFAVLAGAMSAWVDQCTRAIQGAAVADA
jgi:hypothetical protein